jgi:hypothetical protein
MRTNSRTRGCGLALAVVAVATSLPQMAWAQQSGLFPLHPIKRHRVPCDQEDPIYKINKYQYFGYNPTCWHRFPDGWGCPSSEAPDREKSFKETPLGSGLSEGQLPPTGPRPGTEEAPPARPRTLPALPGEGVDPFSPQGRPAPGRGQNGQARPRGAEPDPFDAPDLRPRDNPPGAPAPANPPRGNSPDLSAPADQPDGNSAPRASRDAGDEPGASDDDGPTLALPYIKLPPLADAGSVYEPPPTQAANSANSPATGNSTAPQRRGLISGLLSNIGVNWTRR